MLNKNTFTLAFFLTVVSFFGQLEKADKFYNKGEYIKAIPLYKKAANSSSAAKKDKLEALVKLGNSYKRINDYGQAEIAYREASTIKAKLPAGVEYTYNYAQVLKVNNKYQDAIEQYNAYIRSYPNDVNAKNSVKFIQEIKYYLSKPIEYKVKPVDHINTALSEFAPFVLNDQLMFVGEREVFNFSDYTVNDYNGAPYLKMYIAGLEGNTVKKEKELAKNFNTDYHNGPACVSADGKTLYFSRVDYKSGKDVVNQSFIYTATAGKNGWENIKQVNIGNDEYSVSHPCISSDNNTLYFTSNMPGGYGGKDLYMSRRSGTTWTKPANLGPDINTSGDEMYPSMRKDGILYFSSTGLPGYGGMDIYSAQKIDNKWILIRNEGLDLNSNADDFGMSFLNDSVGYFASNRLGGKGGDDIYMYTFRSKAMSMSGNVLLTQDFNNPAKNIYIKLKDPSGKIIDSMRTDEKGFFEFKNLNSELSYMAVLDENDPAFNGKPRFYMATKDQVVHRVTSKVGNDRFAFKNLPIDPNGLPDLFTDDNLTLAGNLLYSENNTNKPIKNTRLKLVNDFGDVVEYVVTNEFGAFVFRKIPGDQNYLISIEESDISLPAGTRVLLTNKNGKELKSFIVGKDKFNFKILSAEKSLLKEMEVEDAELLMSMDGYMFDQDKKPIANTKIKIREENGSAVYDWITNDKGRFNFKNLSADKNYLFESDENDPSLGGTRRIYIADSKGKIFRILDIIGGKFSFKIIEADKSEMGSFDVDDPWLQALDMKGKKGGAPLTIVESILYASGDYKPDAAGQTILDKVSSVLASNPNLSIEIISHTDSRSSDSFNLILSKKRAQTAVDYIAGKGIDAKRLTAIGLGETKLLNRCANGVNCSDDEHKVNRRTEFKIMDMSKAK